MSEIAPSEAASPERSPAAGRWRAAGERVARLAAVPVAAIVLALVVASLVIIASSLISEGGFNPLLPVVAYGSLFAGAYGSGFGLVNTAVNAAPLVMTGLAVGVGFKAGLFNIGATGQLLMGGFFAAFVGAQMATQPAYVAVPLAIAAGMAAGAAYGLIPGILKAFTGAHEVVTTIMLNAIATAAISGLVNDILRAPGVTFARTADVGNAVLPPLPFVEQIFGRTAHAGVLIALIAVPLTYWLLWRTTLGFEIRTVGANPSAAAYAGMNPRFLIVFTMALCGLLAGLSGTMQILSLGYYPAIYGTSLGFDGITVALLGRAHPIGILLGGILLGGMRAGAPLMQINAKVPVEIIDVIQAVILVFLAADYLVRRLLRLRGVRAGVEELQTVTRTYAEQAAR